MWCHRKLSILWCLGCNWGEEGLRGKLIRKRKGFSKVWWHRVKKKLFFFRIKPNKISHIWIWIKCLSNIPHISIILSDSLQSTISTYLSIYTYMYACVKVCSPDRDTEYFDIVAGVLQGDTLVPYLFIICLDYVLRTTIDKIWENSFELTKKRSWRYPAKTITDADYTVILANTPNQAETQLHSLERTTTGFGLHVNAHKIKYMCFN